MHLCPPGTPHQDTVCNICPNGTFSDVISAQQNCREHRTCGGAGQQLLLKGSSWHDSVCTSCQSTGEISSLQPEHDTFPAFKGSGWFISWLLVESFVSALVSVVISDSFASVTQSETQRCEPPGESRSTPAVFWEFVPEVSSSSRIRKDPALR